MSIYIKGMEMPKTCFNCSIKVDPDNRRCNFDGHIFEETFGKLMIRRDENCPLVPVPPHGRLIDADAMLSFIDCGHLRNPLETSWSDRDVVDMIDARPTIIPADPAEEAT